MKNILPVLSLLLVAVSIANASAQPNIIIIYADDVGYGDLGCYGATGVDTPNLDTLARRGVRFTAAYSTASTCTPSRYSLLTGEYAFRNSSARILAGNAPLIIDPRQPTIASVLKSRGYRTGLVGKWHLGLGQETVPLDWNHEITPGPRELGFDYSFHMAATGDRVPTVYIENGHIVNLDPQDPVAVSYTDPIGKDPTGISHPHLLKSQADEQHSRTIVDGTSRIGYMTGGQSARWTDEELPDTFLGKAIEFIESGSETPFFLYYATHENHVPRIPHPRFLGSSSLGVRGDAIVQMDWGVGRIMETLEANGLTTNTLIIFSSDNGPVLFDGYYDGAVEKNGDHQPAGPFRGGKYTAWEGGTRSPFIVSWPGVVDPGLSDAMISHVDLLASLASLTGAELPYADLLDTRDFSDVLLGNSPDGREYLIQQGMQIKSIRQGPWKYVPPGTVSEKTGIGNYSRVNINGPGALFYLPEDPDEQRNVAHLYPAKARELRQLLQEEVAVQGIQEAL